jgi:hypothetical protein
MRVYQFSVGVHPFRTEYGMRWLATAYILGRLARMKLPAIESPFPDYLEDAFRNQRFGRLLRL